MLNASYPLIGTDMYFYISRLIDAHLHIQNNGIFTIQWWTPSFGGGIPAFPNPLHLQFDITTYFLFMFSPWIATQITYGIMTTLGYFLIYNYIKNHTNLGLTTAICTACIFISNGYFFNHILIGHMNYCTFPIIGIVPYLISSSWPIKKCIIIFTTSISYLIYSAGYPAIFLVYFAIGQLTFILPLLKYESFPFKRLIIIMLVSHIFIIGLSCSKITAVNLHMEIFPRLKEYYTWQPYLLVFFSTIFAQLFLSRILIPFESILPAPADSILFWLIGSRYEFWENDVSLSPVVPAVFLLFVFFRHRKIRYFIKNKYNILGLSATFLIILITIEVSMGKGFFWSFIKNLPVIKSTHVNVRFTGSLTLLFSLLFAFCFSNLLLDKPDKFKKFSFIASLFITYISLVSYQKIISKKPDYRNFDLQNPLKTWSNITTFNSSLKISKILDLNKSEQIQGFDQNVSSFKPHDPLFGYHNEFFQSSLSLGSVDKIDENGFYNFHDPTTFFNPSETILPRKRIHKDDHINFKLFINRKHPNWELPFVQNVANYITLFSFCLFFLFIGYSFFKNTKLTHS